VSFVVEGVGVGERVLLHLFYLLPMLFTWYTESG
jgi:hypothetical protein